MYGELRELKNRTSITFFLSGKTIYKTRVSYELRNIPRLPWSLCGSVVDLSAESEGLRFGSSWGLRFFFFVPRSWQNEKNIFLYFQT